MKKLVLMALAAGMAMSGSVAQAADKLTLQLKWVTQAQFAGYYVAQDQGFYDAEGLDITIKPGGPDVAPAQVIAGGGADVVLDWMPSALASRNAVRAILPCSPGIFLTFTVGFWPSALSTLTKLRATISLPLPTWAGTINLAAPQGSLTAAFCSAACKIDIWPMPASNNSPPMNSCVW